MVIMLDRERHAEAVAADPQVPARASASSPTATSRPRCSPSPRARGVDLLWGIGGTPEGVLSAAAIKCMGGQLVGRLWPRDDDERQRARSRRATTSTRCSTSNRLVSGNDVFFAATGVTDGDLLQGVRYQDGAAATTESLVMRSRSGTVRKVQATHNRVKLRELTGTRLRLASAVYASFAASISISTCSPGCDVAALHLEVARAPRRRA